MRIDVPAQRPPSNLEKITFGLQIFLGWLSEDTRNRLVLENADIGKPALSP
jgi:hypothetical protein